MTPQSTVDAMKQAAELFHVMLCGLENEPKNESYHLIHDTFIFLVQEIERSEDPFNFVDEKKVQ